MEKEDIIKAVIKIFESKGLKFSVLDIATYLKTSKRTIYKFFENKESLLISAVDYVFDDIEKQHYEILKTDRDILSKLIDILLVYPRFVDVQNIEFEESIKEDENFYRLVKEHLTSKWDLTLSVFEQCKNQKLIKDIPNSVFREIMLSIYDSSMTFTNNKEILRNCVEALFYGLKI